MALLKKIRGATLIETLVASAIILIVFVFATLSLNNIFLNSVRNNDSALQNHLRELEYLSIHKKIAVPYYESNQDWDISIDAKEKKFSFNVTNKKNGKEINYVLEDD